MLTLFQQQLTYIFERPITQPEWYWEVNESTDLFDTPLAAFEFIETLMSDAKTYLAPYSNDQIAHGLQFIFNNSCSDLSIDFKEAPVTPERKVAALKSLFYVYRDVFEPRCAPLLLANSREPAPQLESFCYMLWDVTPLSVWLTSKPEHLPQPNPAFMEKMMALDPTQEGYQEKLEAIMQETPSMLPQTPEEQQKFLKSIDQQYKDMDPETRAYYQAIAEVMQKALQLSNPICQESGLHGLGHMASFQSDLAVPIIDAFLNDGQEKPADLIDYAKAARSGMIQ